MNRSLFLATIVAFLCFSFTACGGGTEKSDPEEVATVCCSPTPPASVPNSNPADPNCTPRNVIISLQGDSNMRQLFNTGQLQKDLDMEFGAGATTVLNYTTGYDLSYQGHSCTQGCDVIVENYGMGDQLAGVDPSILSDNIRAMNPTLILTQMTVGSLPTDAAYLAAEKSLPGIPVVDVHAYLQSLAPSFQYAGTPMLVDQIHLTDQILEEVVNNLVAPAVFKQVAPLRCQRN